MDSNSFIARLVLEENSLEVTPLSTNNYMILSQEWILHSLVVWICMFPNGQSVDNAHKPVWSPLE